MNTGSKGKKRTFLDSVKNCLDGISYTITNENNFNNFSVIIFSPN